MAAVTPYYGEQGWTKIDGTNVFGVTLTPEDEPALFMPPMPGGFFPINYTTGISTPSAVVRTSPYAEFWTLTQFGAWFDLGTTVRTGDITSTCTVAYSDGYEATAITGAKGDTFTLEGVQGAPVVLTMSFLGSGIAAGGAAPTRATTAPSMSQCSVFGTASGVHRYVLTYSNRCAPSGELGGCSTGRPVAINANGPVFTLSLLTKAAGAVPTTTETLTIPTSGGTAAFAMTFRQTSGPRKVVAPGETLYERVYTGMHLAAAGVPFSASWT